MVLTGKTALVTGGTRGIGLAIATSLHEAGAQVVVASRSAPIMEHFRSEACDVRDRAALERLGRSLDGLDILVANAGVAVRAEALDLADSDLRQIVETNFYGAFLTCQVLGPLLLRSAEPRCILTSSISAIHGQRLRVAYCGTKAGLGGLVRALAVEWGPRGCTVNAVAPGIIRTPLTQSYMDANPTRVEAAIAHTPLRRLGSPTDVGGIVTFLASSSAAFITGQTIFVDGGLSAGSDWW